MGSAIVRRLCTKSERLLPVPAAIHAAGEEAKALCQRHATDVPGTDKTMGTTDPCDS